MGDQVLVVVVLLRCRVRRSVLHCVQCEALAVQCILGDVIQCAMYFLFGLVVQYSRDHHQSASALFGGVLGKLHSIAHSKNTLKNRVLQQAFD
jgi:hypothetical protein